MDLITIKTFDSPIEMHTYKARLESEGIECFVKDEHSVTINPLGSNALGGIKLRVNRVDAELALSIVDSIQNEFSRGDDGTVITCPKCNSNQLYPGFKSFKGLKGFITLIVTFFFMIFPIYHKTVYKCKECNTEFKS